MSLLGPLDNHCLIRGKINKEAEDPADLPQPPANYRLGSWQKGPCACGLSMQWDIIQP